MIFDDLTCLKRYQGLHPNLDSALAYMEEHELADLELGTYEVDGKKVFFFIQENQLDQSPNEELEFHHRYMDIHLLLDGVETIYYGRKPDEVTKVYQADGDIGMMTCKERYALQLCPENFVAFFPREPHRPNVFGGGSHQVKKCVFKVLMDEN